MTTTTHTPTPWTVSGDYIQGIGQICLSETAEEDVANAAHIVRCVNAHDALVAALRTIRDTTQTIGVASRIARAALRDAGIAESGVAE